jgi:hypothetical protein
VCTEPLEWLKGVVSPEKPDFSHFEMYFMGRIDVQIGLLSDISNQNIST